jgi:hypothetical protein
MKNTLLALPAPRRITIPVGPITAAQIRSLCRVEKLREFDVISTDGKCRVVQTQSWPYKGKFKTYPKFTNNAYITSYATISDSMATIHHAPHTGKTEKVIFAPAGMIFATDQSGLLLRRVSDDMDYHPTIDDLFSPKFATVVRQQMAINFRRRAEARKAEKLAARNKKKQARIEKIFVRDLPTTRVTLADSRAAGNCVEGSLAFCERKLGISRQEVIDGAHLFSVAASKLIARANGQTEQAMRAVRAAWKRETMVSI